jgi:hypothetical protein
MIWFLKTFWRSLSFLGLLVGIYYLPADLLDPAGASAAWRGLFEMLPPNAPLWAFALIATAYIIWLDARPWLYERFRVGPRTRWMKRAEEAEAKLKAIEEAKAAALAAEIAPPPDVDEGPAKNEAKKKIGLAARDFLWPTIHALVPYYAYARDMAKARISVIMVREAFGKTCDRIHGGADETHRIISVHELQDNSKLQKLTLHQAQSDYYYNYCRHMKAVQLTYQLIESLAPMPLGMSAKLRALHDDWYKVQSAAVEEHIRLGKEDLELTTIGTMHTHVLKDLRPPDWERLTQK